MRRESGPRSTSLRFALFARVSTIALIAATAISQQSFAGGGGIGRNPNDLKDGDIDGNAGNGHHTSPPPQTACDGGAGVIGLVTITNATPMPLTGKIECVTVNTTVEHDVVNEATVGDPGVGHSSFIVGTGGIIEGQLWNKGTISGGYASLTGSGLGALTILGDVQNGVLNSGLISSPGNNGIQLGSSANYVFVPGKIEGGITNDGSITALNDGVAAIAGSLTGGLTNNEAALITGGNAAIYIADSFSSWTGGISNAGSLRGTDVGILIGAPGATNVQFAGGIFNDETGVISSGVGPAIFASGASYAGGLTNWGLITETGETFTLVYGGSGVILDALTVSGDIANHGTIEGVYRQGLLITDNVGLFSGSIANTGEVGGAKGGVVVLAHTVNGNFSNTGLINGGANTGVAYFNNIIEGVGGAGATATFTNTGTIVGGAGFVIDAATVRANFVNGDANTGAGEISGNTSAGVILAAQSWTGDVTNNGSVSGATVGMAVGYDPFSGKASPENTLTGNIVNNGSIHGGTAGVVIAVDTFTGNFTNNGSITGGHYGLALEGGNNFEGALFAANCADCAQPLSVGGGTFTGNVTNNDFMSGDTALFVSYDTFTGNLTNANTGLLSGSNYGLLLDVDTFHGNLSNAGTITAGGGDSIGVAMQIGTGSTEGGTVLSSQSFVGDVSNTGIIHGQNTGLGVVLDTYTAGTAGFTNSGTIAGDNRSGVYIRANQWTGDFVNETGGRITGGNTGVYIGAGTIDGDFTNHGFVEGGLNGVFINAGTITGDFTNDGTIIGHSSDTGWNIWTASYTGNIANNTGGLLTAPSNALHLRIDTFSGQISNDGVISAPSGNAVAIEGYSTSGTYTGAFTNTGTISADNIGINLSGAKLTGGIVNNGGTISGATAISTYAATGATTITNTGGGVILGDLRLANNFGDTFIAQNGGIVGDIIGDPASSNDDSVIVQNGTHYFIGKASNLSNFTVASGGLALMGATSEGDPSGAGFTSSNVSAINVNSGGTLYIDKTASLSAGSYTQASGGTLEFYLGAPDGANFANLTGTQTAVAGTDYGQIHLTGSATLDGAVAGFLDPAFASANSGLNAVVYNDVLVADGGISGDFSTLALISNSNLFELSEKIDGNTVDLTVTRASLGQIGEIGTVVVETGGPWKAMVNDRTNGIGSGSCSLAGSGWCLNAFAQNDAGGTTVMNDATPGADPFGWLRTGTRHEGETAVWGRAVGVWGDTSGDANHAATDFNSYGGIVGIDHVFTPVFLAGAAAQWTRSSIDFNGVPDNARVKSLEIGGYMSYGDARFYLNMNSSVIFHSIEVTRFAPGGSAHGDYDGTTISGYAEAGRIFETYEGFRIQPLAALSYAHLDTDAYNETGSATSLLHVFDASLDSLKSMLGARLAYPIALDSGAKMVPETRVIWTHELLDDHSAFDANPISNPSNIATVTGQTYNRNSLVLGAGLTAPLSTEMTLFLDYDAALNADITTHTISGGLRARW